MIQVGIFLRREAQPVAETHANPQVRTTCPSGWPSVRSRAKESAEITSDSRRARTAQGTCSSMDASSCRMPEPPKSYDVRRLGLRPHSSGIEYEYRREGYGKSRISPGDAAYKNSKASRRMVKLLSDIARFP